MSSNGPSLLERLSSGGLSNTPGGRQGRVKAPVRSKPYSASPRTSVGPSTSDSSLPKAKHTKGDPNDQWKHDLFAPHNGISGGELGARLNGDMGRQVTSGAGGGEKAVAKKAFQAALGVNVFEKKEKSVSQGLTIKGSASVSSATVEVDGLAPGTTADDVAEIFSECGNVLEKRLLSKPSDPTARVYIKFESASAAQSAVSKFDKQAADGKILHVTVTNSALGSRMGVKTKPADSPVDLLAPSESVMGGMRSDELIKTDPRAKVIVDPSGTNAQLQPATPSSAPAQRGQPRGRGGRGVGRGGRPRGGQSNRGGKLSERMNLD